MQLDLFCDNHRTIGLNCAEEMLHALRLEEALAVYQELLADRPADAELLMLQAMVDNWRKTLRVFYDAPVGHQRLHDLWLLLTPETPSSLMIGLCRMLIDELQQLSSPELIFVPPRFHLGVLLLAVGHFAAADDWFARALDAGIDARGRFLGWRGDALTLLGDSERAMGVYLAAFREDPQQVDLKSLKNSRINELLTSLDGEDHGLEEEGLVAWLPVWGWFQGVLGLSLQEPITDRAAYVAGLDAAHSCQSLSAARLWYDDLRYAEYLRTAFRDDREMVRVRRRMRQLNAFMFQCYMEKLRNLSAVRGGTVQVKGEGLI